MNHLPAIFRANEGLIVATALCVGISLVLTLVGLIMKSGGASLRPIVFLAVLMGPLAISFLLVELIRARRPATQPETTHGLPMRGERFAEPEKLFGPGIAAELIQDARPVFAEFLGEAEHAELAIVGNGETALVAQFPTAEQAMRAAAFYWQAFKLTGTSGDEQRGWRGRRAASSDFVELLRSGRHLFVWTALTKEACAARRAASASATVSPDVTPAPREALLPALQPLGAFLRRPAIKIFGLMFMVALYTAWFFKGAAWASSAPAAPGAPAMIAAELGARLESINALDVPFRIERGNGAGEFFATWRYADARWADHARAHGLRRTIRIRLTLDESARVVRATDYSAAYDWSAGGDGARIAWQASLGIVFFQSEQRRVFGLQLDEQGRFKPDLSYGYKFNLHEMKTPLIEAVTRAGWTWRPVVWQGPKGLRWLTE